MTREQILHQMLRDLRGGQPVGHVLGQSPTPVARGVSSHPPILGHGPVALLLPQIVGAVLIPLGKEPASPLLQVPSRDLRLLSVGRPTTQRQSRTLARARHPPRLVPRAKPSSLSTVRSRHQAQGSLRESMATQGLRPRAHPTVRGSRTSLVPHRAIASGLLEPGLTKTADSSATLSLSSSPCKTTFVSSST